MIQLCYCCFIVGMFDNESVKLLLFIVVMLNGEYQCCFNPHLSIPNSSWRCTTDENCRSGQKFWYNLCGLLD